MEGDIISPSKIQSLVMDGESLANENEEILPDLEEYEDIEDVVEEEKVDEEEVQSGVDEKEDEVFFGGVSDKELYIIRRLGSVMKIQRQYRKWRRNKGVIPDRMAFLSTKKNIVNLQSVWRGRVARKTFMVMKKEKEGRVNAKKKQLEEAAARSCEEIRKAITQRDSPIDITPAGVPEEDRMREVNEKWAKKIAVLKQQKSATANVYRNKREYPEAPDEAKPPKVAKTFGDTRMGPKAPLLDMDKENIVNQSISQLTSVSSHLKQPTSHFGFFKQPPKTRKFGL